MKYSEAFKSKLVGKMVAPGGPSANALSKDVGVHQSTLSRWLRGAARVEDMKNQRGKSSWRAAQKLEAALEAATLSGEELGKDAALAETAALLGVQLRVGAMGARLTPSANR